MRTTAHKLQYDLSVEVRLPDGQLLHCRSHDIENHAITLRSPYNVKVGTVYLLHFGIFVSGSPHSITTAAVVQQCYLVGEEDLFYVHLRFKELEREPQQQLNAFLEEHRSN